LPKRAEHEIVVLALLVAREALFLAAPFHRAANSATPGWR
jgi:hypothetical protein